MVFESNEAQSIVTYDGQDVVQGTFYRTLYGFKPFSGSLLLMPEARESSLIYTSGLSDLDFDYTFNHVTYLSGKIFVTLSWRGIESAGTTLVWVRVTAYHVSATGTETALGVEQTENLSVAAGVGTSKRNCLPIPIAKTKFKNGEKLRINCIVQKSGDALTGPYIYHDPAGRLSTITGDGIHTNFPTTLIADIPFVSSTEF